MVALAVTAAGVGALQPVEPMAPTEQQQIEVLNPTGSQALEGVAGGAQDVHTAEPVSPGRRAASTAGKVVLGVVAATVAIGATALSLLFF